METKSVLIYTVHKAGSMFVHELTAELTGMMGLPYFSVHDEAFRQSIFNEGWARFIESSPGQPACFGPIRAGAAEPSIPEAIDSYAAILHLRDPRDVLTSLYYSAVYSHPPVAGRFDPADEERRLWEEAGIDEFVLKNAEVFGERYESLLRGIGDCGGATVLRYEEMVLDYPGWLMKFLRACEPLGDAVSYFDRLEEAHRDDFSAVDEDRYAHKRKVTPGDHREKRARGTIAELDRVFAGPLKELGYEISQETC